MAHYLMDTNHISPLVTPGHRLQGVLARHHRNGDSFGIAVPALTEMLFGIRTLPRAESNLKIWLSIDRMYIYYQIEKEDAEHAADLQVILRRRGWQLGTIDALIASIALRYGLTLLTTDNDFKAIPALKQENWLAG